MAQYKIKEKSVQNKMIESLKPTKEDLVKLRNFAIGFGWFFIIVFKSIGFLFAVFFLGIFNSVKKQVDKEMKK